MTDELCGAPTGSDEPCQNPATEGDSCWIESHGGHASGAGRPSKFTDERRDDALAAARSGASQAGCARAAGVDESTLRGWLERRPEFSRAFARARAEGEQTLIDEGLRDDDVDSSMAKFLLSTSFGYVKTEKREHEHSGEGGGPIEVTVNRERYDG